MLEQHANKRQLNKVLEKDHKVMYFRSKTIKFKGSSSDHIGKTL